VFWFWWIFLVFWFWRVVDEDDDSEGELLSISNDGDNSTTKDDHPHERDVRLIKMREKRLKNWMNKQHFATLIL
jgi:hypothetical protein